jgi:Fe-S-cluster containining protein
MKTKRKKSRKTSRAPLERNAPEHVHLVVVRDASGTPQSLELSAPLFGEAWQNSLTVSAARTAYGMLADTPSLGPLVELARKTLAAASQVGENALAQSSQVSPACRKDCSYCCYHRVDVSAPELLAIFDHINRHFTPLKRQEFQAKLAHFVEQTAGMSPADRYSPEYPCPLLDEGHCSVYSARPFTCRGANSLSEEACKESLHDERTRAQYASGEFVIPRYLEPIRAAHAVAAGLQLSLSDLYGLDMRPVELAFALNLLLQDHEGRVTRWLQGEAAFSQP